MFSFQCLVHYHGEINNKAALRRWLSSFPGKHKYIDQGVLFGRPVTNREPTSVLRCKSICLVAASNVLLTVFGLVDQTLPQGLSGRSPLHV